MIRLRIRRMLLVTAMFTLALGLSGCWDSIPIENLAYVAAMGVDASSQPGNMMITFGIVQPRQANPAAAGGTGGGGGQQPPFFYTLTVEAESIGEAVQVASLQTPHRLFLGQMQAVVFGRKLAERGLTAVLDDLWRQPELRPALLLYTAAGTAQDVLSVSSVLEPLPFETLLGLARNPLGDAVTNVRLSDFSDYLTEPGIDPVTPILGVECAQVQAAQPSGVLKCPGGGTPELRVEGTAVYQGDRLAESLTGPASLPLRWLVGNFAGADIPVRVPQGLVVFRLQNIHHRAWVVDRPGGLRAEVSVSLAASVRGVGPQGPVLTGALLADWQNRLAGAVRAMVESSVRQVLAQGTDPLGFGWWTQQHLPGLWASDSPIWREELPRMGLDVSVKARIRTVGLIR